MLGGKLVQFPNYVQLNLTYFIFDAERTLLFGENELLSQHEKDPYQIHHLTKTSTVDRT